jgi:hypothetical protein
VNGKVSQLVDSDAICCTVILKVRHYEGQRAATGKCAVLIMGGDRELFGCACSWSQVNYPETQISSVTRLFLGEVTGDKNT